MPTLELTRDDYRSLLGYRLGSGRGAAAGATAWSDAQKAMIDQCLNSGLRRFYFPDPIPPSTARHRWSFLYPEAELLTSAPYATGTITVVDGVVTLASGTFPTWAAQGVLTPSNTSTYEVASWDSTTQITLEDKTVDVDAGTGYSLGRVEYDMEPDFGGMEGPFTFGPTVSQTYDPIQITSWGMIRRLRQLYRGTTSRPTLAVVLPKRHTGSAPTAHKVIFDYVPSSAWTLFYRYKIKVNALDSALTHVAGGAEHSETILMACYWAAAEARGLDPQEEEQARKRFMDRLKASIAEDEGMTPNTLGYNADDSDVIDDPRDLRRFGAPVYTFGGTAYT